MIHIVHNSGEFNIDNLELFISNNYIGDLKWFIKNVVKIAINKDEVKSIIEFQTKELIYYYETKQSYKSNMTEAECKQWVKKAKRLLEELEKI